MSAVLKSFEREGFPTRGVGDVDELRAPLMVELEGPRVRPCADDSHGPNHGGPHVVAEAGVEGIVGFGPQSHPGQA